MAPFSYLLHSILLLLLCFFIGCGRKRRYPFSFAEKKTAITVATLDLPSVQNVHVVSTKSDNKIFWNHISEQEKQEHTHKNTHFVGYNIYRLTKNGFIPKHPLNKTPVTVNSYIITQKKSDNNYLVRAVFKQYNKYICGPLSRIARPEKDR